MIEQQNMSITTATKQVKAQPRLSLLGQHCRRTGQDLDAVRRGIRARQEAEARAGCRSPAYCALIEAADECPACRARDRIPTPGPGPAPAGREFALLLADTIRRHPDVLRPVLLDLLADGITDIVLAVEGRT
jgi:hypothetical protein